jgi:rod shape-determining protein MreD
MNIGVSLTSREEIEVHRFSWVVSLGVPALALLIQSYLPLKMGFLKIFDLPLLVTIFFAVARRRPVPGMITGALIGTFQDALAGGDQKIGLFGISNTIIGYLASSLGVKVDVDNPGSRFLMTLAFYVIHHIVYMVVNLGLVGASEPWLWGNALLKALANALLSVVLFALLDKFKQRI